MKKLQAIPETTPKAKGMTGNHSLALKQLWVTETELAPIVQIQIANDRDINHPTSKLHSYPIPNRQKPDESNGQIRIPKDQSCNEYWIPDIDQECRQTKGTFNQTVIDALHSRQLQNKEQGNTLEQRVNDVIRGWEQKTRVCKPRHSMSMNKQCGQIIKAKIVQ